MNILKQATDQKFRGFIFWGGDILETLAMMTRYKTRR